MFFNKLNWGFYDPSEKLFYGDNWPDKEDLVEIDNDEYERYSSQPPRGHILAADLNGKPTWQEVPGQIEENNVGIIKSLMAVASAKIAPLQDAVDLDIATEDEIAALKEWKLYRIKLNRIDTTVTDLNLPVAPSA